jgi:ABC-type glycerol-3-phosphate transport system substrate-binding protein
MDKAKNREAGWAFARFIGLEAANGAFWNISFGQLPPRLSFREDPAWKEHEAQNPLVPAYLEAQKSTDLPYYGPGKDVLSQPFRRGKSQIGVIRRDEALRGGETEGSRTLAHGGLGW